MQKHYTPFYFKAYELVDPELFNILHEREIYKLFDPNVLKFADWARERWGQCTINDWKWTKEQMPISAQFRWSGYRTPKSPYYRQGSMHSFGQALDLKFKKITASKIRTELREIESIGHKIPFITRVEDDVTWLHVDTKPTEFNTLHFFKP